MSSHFLLRETDDFASIENDPEISFASVAVASDRNTHSNSLSSGPTSLTSSNLKLVPRVDAVLYQAEVPEIVERLPNPDPVAGFAAKVDWYRGTRAVNSTSSTVNESINEFLLLTRNLFEPCYVTGYSHWMKKLSIPSNLPIEIDGISGIPLESDARAIEYLASYNYNVKNAWFNLTASLGCSKDCVTSKLISNAIERYPTGSVFNETKEKFLKAKHRFIGSFDSSSKTLNDVDSSFDDNNNSCSTPHSYSMLNFPRNVGDFLSPGNKIEQLAVIDQVSNVVDDDNQDDQEEEAIVGLASGRMARTGDKEKQELKKRWSSLYDRGLALRKAIALSHNASGNNSPTRNLLVEVQRLLDEASTMPLYVNYQSTLDDFADRIKLMLGDFVKDIVASRNWIAKLRDKLYKSKNIRLLKSSLYQSYALSRSNQLMTSISKPISTLLHIAIPSLLETRSESSMSFTHDIDAEINHDLRKLLSESNHLKILPNEVYMIHTVLAEVDSIKVEIKDILKQGVFSPVFENNDAKSGESRSDTRNETKSNSRSRLDVKKVSIERVSELLKQIERLPVFISDYIELETLYKLAMDLSDRVNSLIIARDVYALRKFKAKDAGNSRGRILLSDAKDFLNALKCFCLDILYLDQIEDIVNVGISWCEEVNAAIDPKKTISMRRVDTLIAQGETLPFDLTEDLDRLKEKKVFAKAWLEKMRKSFQAKVNIQNIGVASEGLIYRRKTTTTSSEGMSSSFDMNNYDDLSGGRIGLEDMKQMISEGQMLLDDDDVNATGAGSGSIKQHNRELQRAQTIVDLADKWLDRVRDILRSDTLIPTVQTTIDPNNGVNITFESSKESNTEEDAADATPSAGEAEMEELMSELREMLDEAKTMPVIMDEVLILRTHVQILDWANKMRPILKKSKSWKLSELQRHFRESQKIRNSLPEHIDLDYPLKKLPEEELCESIISNTEDWLDQMKKIIQFNAVKRPTTLKKVIELYLASNGILVNIENEIRPLRVALNSTLQWIKRFHDILDNILGHNRYVWMNTNSTSASNRFAVQVNGNDESIFDLLINNEAVLNMLQRDELKKSKVASSSKAISEDAVNPEKSSKSSKKSKKPKQQVEENIEEEVEIVEYEGGEDENTMSSSASVGLIASIRSIFIKPNVDVEGKSMNSDDTVTVLSSKVAEPVLYTNLHQIVFGGSTLVLEFDEIIMIRNMLATVDNWITEVKETIEQGSTTSVMNVMNNLILPKNDSFNSTLGFKPTFRYKYSASRSRVVSRNEVTSTTAEIESEVDATTTTSTVALAPSLTVSGSQLISHLRKNILTPRQHLIQLANDAPGLHVNVDQEVKRISQILEASAAWDKHVFSKLKKIDDFAKLDAVLAAMTYVLPLTRLRPSTSVAAVVDNSLSISSLDSSKLSSSVSSPHKEPNASSPRTISSPAKVGLTNFMSKSTGEETTVKPYQNFGTVYGNASVLSSIGLVYPYFNGVFSSINTSMFEESGSSKILYDLLKEDYVVSDKVLTTSLELESQAMDEVHIVADELRDLLEEAESNSILCSRTTYLVKCSLTALSWASSVRDLMRSGREQRKKSKESVYWGEVTESTIDDLLRSIDSFTTQNFLHPKVISLAKNALTPELFNDLKIGDLTGTVLDSSNNESADDKSGSTSTDSANDSLDKKLSNLKPFFETINQIVDSTRRSMHILSTIVPPITTASDSVDVGSRRKSSNKRAAVIQEDDVAMSSSIASPNLEDSNIEMTEDTKLSEAADVDDLGKVGPEEDINIGAPLKSSKRISKTSSRLSYPMEVYGAASPPTASNSASSSRKKVRPISTAKSNDNEDEESQLKDTSDIGNSLTLKVASSSRKKSRSAANNGSEAAEAVSISIDTEKESVSITKGVASSKKKSRTNSSLIMADLDADIQSNMNSKSVNTPKTYLGHITSNTHSADTTSIIHDLYTLSALIPDFQQYHFNIVSAAEDKLDKDEMQLDKYLPASVSAFVLLWRQCLYVYKQRIREVQLWIQRKTRLMNRVTSDAYSIGNVKLIVTDEINHLLLYASKRGLSKSTFHFNILKSYVNKILSWQTRAQSMLAYPVTFRNITSGGEVIDTAHGSDTVTVLRRVDALQDFIQEGESMTSDLPEINLLKQEVKKAKAWNHKLALAGLDSSSVAASNVPKDGSGATIDLNELVKEAATICVDLSEGVRAIHESRVKYCLCRQEYHSDMVGCDTCKEWYHCACVGLSKSQAEKLDKYICIRCLLIYSFDEAGAHAGRICNKWMLPENISSHRISSTNKFQMRFRKEIKDYKKYESLLLDSLQALSADPNYSKYLSHVPNLYAFPLLFPTLPIRNLASDIASDLVTIRDISSLAVPSEQTTLNRIKTEYEESKLRLVKLVSEFIEVKKLSELESMKFAECQDWMFILQKIIWPTKRDEVVAGWPLGPNNFPISLGMNPGLVFNQITPSPQKMRYIQDQIQREQLAVKQSSESNIALATAVQSASTPTGDATRVSNTVDLVKGDQGPEAYTDNSNVNNEDIGETSLKNKLNNISNLLKAHDYYQKLQTEDNLLRVCVPDAIKRATEAAISLSVDGIDDVLVVIESFRWMSWCNIMLHSIRAPLTIRALNKLVMACQALRFKDSGQNDKILKTFQSILNKAVAWKSKVTKLMLGVPESQSAQDQVVNEVVKLTTMNAKQLTDLVLEANGIPINSKAKVQLKEYLKQYQLLTGNAGVAVTTTVTHTKSSSRSASSSTVEDSQDVSAKSNSRQKNSLRIPMPKLDLSDDEADDPLTLSLSSFASTGQFPVSKSSSVDSLLNVSAAYPTQRTPTNKSDEATGLQTSVSSTNIPNLSAADSEVSAVSVIVSSEELATVPEDLRSADRVAVSPSTSLDTVSVSGLQSTVKTSTLSSQASAAAVSSNVLGKVAVDIQSLGYEVFTPLSLASLPYPELWPLKLTFPAVDRVYMPGSKPVMGGHVPYTHSFSSSKSNSSSAVSASKSLDQGASSSSNQSLNHSLITQGTSQLNAASQLSTAQRLAFPAGLPANKRPVSVYPVNAVNASSKAIVNSPSGRRRSSTDSLQKLVSPLKRPLPSPVSQSVAPDQIQSDDSSPDALVHETSGQEAQPATATVDAVDLVSVSTTGVEETSTDEVDAPVAKKPRV